MNRERTLNLVLALSSWLLVCALILRLHSRGGPFLDIPKTILDHVSREPHENRNTLLLLPKVRPLLEPHKSVTCFRPVDGKWNYDANFLVAAGQLPGEFVVPAFAARDDIPTMNLADYVIAVDTPFTHSRYRLIATYPEGRLYRSVR